MVYIDAWPEYSRGRYIIHDGIGPKMHMRVTQHTELKPYHTRYMMQI